LSVDAGNLSAPHHMLLKVDEFHSLKASIMQAVQQRWVR
jgi:hypothetical protein